MDGVMYLQISISVFLLHRFKDSQGILSRFQISSTFDNYTCQAGDMLFRTSANSVFACLSLCAEQSTCYSVFFNEEQEICRGCNVMYSSRYLPEEHSGSQYYHVSPECPDSTWTSFQKSCYKLSTHQLFFVGASDCQTFGGYVIYIQTAAENAWAKSFVESDTSTWVWYVGITDCELNTQWKYYGTETTAEFLDFGPSEGLNEAECCAFMYDKYDYQWADVSCEHHSFFISDLVRDRNGTIIFNNLYT